MTVKAWVTFAGCVLIVLVLYRAQALPVPIALAILLTFVLTPPVTWLQRWIGRIPAVLAIVTLVFTVFGLAGWGLARQMDQLSAPRSGEAEVARASRFVESLWLRSNTMVWFAVLRHAPAILSAADALLRRATTSRADDHTRSIEMRIDELAESSRASAELIQDMARQLQALAMVQDATVRKVRVAMGISVAASVVAVAAVVIGFVR